MNLNIEQLENMISAAINTKYKELPPTEDEFLIMASSIRDSLNILYPVSDEEFQDLLRRLASYLVIQMDVGVYINDNKQEHKSWLPARRADLEFFFWLRYKRYLEEVKHWNPRVTATLDRVSDEIVDLLGDPTSESAFQRRGLVLGDVQSGKTANYTAICNKAADTGYRIIIVMAGMMENLRKQTQERLDAEFSGRLSQYFLNPKAEQGLRNLPVGVGRYGTTRRIASFTSVTKDFDIGVLKSNDLALHNVSDPVVFVVKKNKQIINNLINWLTAYNTNQTTGKIMLSMLLIDDEADNASVNTRSEDDPAAINACIRKLLNSFYQASYVGITATPFANIFINPDTEDEMIGDDLFPRDFIYSLASPTNYIGADRIFGEEPDYDSFLGPLYASEMDAFFPLSHKKTLEVDELPPSMLEAMAYFILANGIRDVRGSFSEHRSMMIHVSRFTDVQNEIAALANEWLIQVKSDLQNYAKLPEAQIKQIQSIMFLRFVWEKHRLGVKCNILWNKFLSEYLYHATAPIDTRAVNQSTGTTSLDYYNHKDDGLRVIAVGGNSLSRGLTLEGLCVSYFYRKSQMYDTLLQMGRWFGYRPGYDDLVKIWISKEAIDWYGYITSAAEELKNEIVRMKLANQTPMEFGLKVRQDPNSLIATARNKMRSATAVSRPIIVSGKLLETPRLKSDPDVLLSNERAFKTFICRLDEIGKKKTDERISFWKDVCKDDIVQLLLEFETHPWHMAFQGRALADYIEKKMDDTGWDVAIPEGSDSEPYRELWSGDEQLSVHPEKRFVSTKNGQISISGTKVRVGAGGASSFGLTDQERKRAEAQFRHDNPGKKNVPDSAYLIQGRAPILMLHVIQVNYEKSEIDEQTIVPPYLFALGVGFPSTGSVTKTANYVVNMVELRNWMDPDEDDDE
ncbi:MAG TPA: endonuclease [Desulfotomaculum sp.]|nr:MAG: Z1 domain-containing protein [Desulfotomaculum sp. 46_296]HAG10721.1 endonuclease [Desulfotomaculum sp.]